MNETKMVEKLEELFFPAAGRETWKRIVFLNGTAGYRFTDLFIQRKNIRSPCSLQKTLCFLNN